MSFAVSGIARGRIGRRALAAAGVIAASVGLAAAVPSTASAADASVFPDVAAQSFAGSAAGWTASDDASGLCSALNVPGVTCPLVSTQYVPAGPTDGFVRSRLVSVASLLSGVTTTWTSPAFTTPAAVDAATFGLSVRANVGQLITLGGGGARMTVVLDDTAPGATDVPVVTNRALPASDAFTRITADASALQPAHTYRIVVSTTLSSAATVRVAGDVDIDDVSVRTVDLLPPTGLTAAATAGNTAVGGAVDPHGQTTSVSVRYGTTTGYGATAGPVAVGGTGPQPYAIPLAGLLPGSTYHFQVTATNADGTASTTDGTFVAPMPPADGAPFVAGSARSRARTVTYAGSGALSAATVRVRDGNGTVLSSWPDAAPLDGTVEITLPPADGDYTVDVVRTGPGGTTTSTATAVTLDTTAPDTSGVGLAVAPRVGADLARTVTFTAPADAIGARVQVLDASGAPVGAPVTATGGAATVMLGPDDGTYAVRLTLTDAAGNAATVTSVDLTLDRVAPAAGPAPAVSGPADDRARIVTFTRDASATGASVEVLDAGGAIVLTVPVAAGDSQGITLPAVDGTYRVRVRQQDAAGNGAVTGDTTVTLDRSTPDAGPAPTVTGPADDRERHVTFVRASSATTVVVEIVDSGGGVAGTVTVASGAAADVTLPDSDGTYRIRVRQSDALDHSDVTPETSVTLDRSTIDAGPAPTVTGSARVRGRHVTFARAGGALTVAVEVVDAGGTVRSSTAVPAGDEADVTLPDADGTYTIRVHQQGANSRDATSPGTAVSLDRDAPAAGGAPAVSGATTSRTRGVTFTRAGDTATAVVEILDAQNAVVGTVAVPAGHETDIRLPDADGEYRVRVVQTDAAGNEATSPSTAIGLDRTGPAAGGAPTVTGATSAPARTVTFTRAGDAVAAAIEILDADGTVVDTVAVTVGASGAGITLPDRDGTYAVRVRQTDAAGNASVTGPTAVTLDRVPAAGGAPRLSGTSDDLLVQFDRDPRTTRAMIEVRGPAGAVVATVEVPTGSSARLGLPDTTGAYTIRVWQFDADGSDNVTPSASHTRAVTPTPATPAPTREGVTARPVIPVAADPGPRPAPVASTPGRTDPAGFGPVLEACYGADLALTDVAATGSRVSVAGLTRAAAGTAIAIADTAGRTVATTAAGADGRFTATFARPAGRAATTTRYRAVAGALRSRALKLVRANTLSSAQRSGRTLVLRGGVMTTKVGRHVSFQVRGGRGAKGCAGGGRRLTLSAPAQFDAATGRYVLRVRVPAGAGRIVLRTRASGTATSASLFVVV
jgi:hypothetical protein